MSKQFQARQGDIYFEAVSNPKGKPLNSPILAHGEVTGHMHKIISPSVDKYDSSIDVNGDIYLRCQTEDIVVWHDEHNKTILPKGKDWYLVSRQREYDAVSEMRERRVQD